MSDRRLHGPLGCALTGALVCATPGAMGLATWTVGLAFARVDALPLTIVYGWLLTMGIGQVVVVGPVLAAALLTGRTRCAAGMGVGALLVLLANVAILLLFALTGAFSAVARQLWAWW